MPQLEAHLRKNWLRIYWVLSLCLVLFACGVAVGLFRIFPYGVLESVAAAAADWARYPKHNARVAPQKFLATARHEGNGVVEYVEGKAFRGTTFMEGFFGGRIRMRLIDVDGTVIHEWPVSFNEIWPEAPHLRKKPHDWDIQIHGALLYPNGDVVFNFQYGGLVRIDKCARVQWKLPYETHHSIFQDTEGNLWVPARKLRETSVDKFPEIPAPFYEDFILKVSPQGVVLDEISILDAIFGSQYEGVMFANGAHVTKIDVPLDDDFTHLNDIDVLSPEMALAFPLFKAGDLLVSVRNLNLLLVLCPDTHQIKWSMTGPYLRQHDPDFLRTGRISVFDNRRDRSGGNDFGGSRILELDPSTGKVITIYGDHDDEQFYTETMGDHAYLPNGNILITESEAGRAFEVTVDGEIVWSFVNRWDEESVALISRATRYPEGYMASAEQEKCHD
jgi:Arylsulfotransferase (ASST)